MYFAGVLGFKKSCLSLAIWGVNEVTLRSELLHSFLFKLLNYVAVTTFNLLANTFCGRRI